jgi:hypothetical protein
MRNLVLVTLLTTSGAVAEKVKKPEVTNFKDAVQKFVKSKKSKKETKYYEEVYIDNGYSNDMWFYMEGEKVFDENGNLAQLIYGRMEVNTTYSKDGVLLYGKTLYSSGWWTETSYEFGDENVTETTKDSEGYIEIVEAPKEFAETYVDKYENGLLVYTATYIGDEVQNSEEFKFNDLNQTIYKKFTYENSFSEHSYSYDEEGTLLESECNRKTIYTEEEEEELEYVDGETENGYYYEMVDADGVVRFREEYFETNESHIYISIDENGVKTTTIFLIEEWYIDEDEWYTDEENYVEIIIEDGMVLEGIDSTATIPPEIPAMDATADAPNFSDITAEFLESLPDGWNLIGTGTGVSLEMLSDMKSIFKYDGINQSWEYIVFDEDGEPEIEEGELQINPKDGFWINK